MHNLMLNRKDKEMKRNLWRRNEDGTVLVVALIILVFLTLIGITISVVISWIDVFSIGIISGIMSAQITGKIVVDASSGYKANAITHIKIGFHTCPDPPLIGDDVKIFVAAYKNKISGKV